MDIKVKIDKLPKVKCDVLILNSFENVKMPSGGTGAVNEALGDLISSYVIEKEHFKGKLNETYLMPTYGKIPANKILLVGLGKTENFNLNKIREVTATAFKKLKNRNVKKIGTALHGAGTAGLNPEKCAQMITEGITLGLYDFNKYKTEKNECSIEEIEIVEFDSAKLEAIKEGILKGKTFANATNSARNLINEPASVMTPTEMAEQAMSIKGIECRIIEEEEARHMGMNTFLAVSQGSSEPPKFIHMTYNPQKHIPPSKKVAIVGKGVTFDSGGLDLKPPSAMLNMKDDMSGSAAVIGVMKALPILKPNIKVHAIIAACENMPGSKAFKPGDILTTMNGKTIEVDNTDAEGRLTLADALSYAVDLNVDEIIDIATLTGACLVALGKQAAGIMGNNQEIIDKLIKSAEQGGEKLWQLPLFEKYKDTLKSNVADMKNAGSREAGASVAGIFLKEFVDNKKWAHIDIAGPAFLDKPSGVNPKGGTGAGVRTILNYLLNS